MAPQQFTTGQRAAAVLKAEKQSAVAGGRTLSWEEVATIIDSCCPTPKPARTKPPAVPGPFGVKTTIPPLPEWVTAYSVSIGYPLNGPAWCDSYEQKAWKVGKSRMKNWQAAVRNWKTNGWGDGGIALAGAGTSKAKDYSRL